MVKDVTKFYKHNLGGGGGGRGMVECVCRVSYRILSFGREGGMAKFGVDVERVCIT